VAYVSFSQNWGSLAGASIYHPHFQIVAVPVIPARVMPSLRGSKIYYAKNKKCPHCVILNFELKYKKRIIFENDHAVAIAPYFSKESYEVRVFPKRHNPYFEEASEKETASVAEALQAVLYAYKNKLGDPDYNFAVHTSPIEKKGTYKHYHWHVEVVPKINTSSGLETGTYIKINEVDPDIAAKILRG
jgi:UDPglucose--hexose-1-phosphate uridylyltransferase